MCCRHRIPREWLGPLPIVLASGAATGLVRITSLNSTHAVAAVSRGFRSHRIRATTHPRGIDLDSHCVQVGTHLIGVVR